MPGNEEGGATISPDLVVLREKSTLSA